MKILICSAIRNRAPILKFFLTQIKETALRLVADSGFETEVNLSIYENDSNDGTKEILQNFDQSVFKEAIITTDNINSKEFGSVVSHERIINISNARNKCLDQFSRLNEMDIIVFADADYAWSNNVLFNMIKTLVNKQYNIVSAYSLHADIPRPPMELYDKWATRAKKEHWWWHCTPYAFLPEEVEVYSTFNGLCVYNAKPFIDGLRFEAKSIEHKEDVEHISICEGFRALNMNKIFMIKNAHVLHFMDCNNFQTWLEQQMAKLQMNGK